MASRARSRRRFRSSISRLTVQRYRHQVACAQLRRLAYLSAVTDQFYYLTLAGLGLSVAGFAGLVTALRGDGRWSRADLWRLRNIIQTSLVFVFVALLPVPIFRAVGDERLTISIMSAVVALIFANGLVRAFRDDREWPGYAKAAALIVAPQIALMLVNVFLSSIALLMFGLLSVLSFPVQLFIRVIRDFQPPTME